MKRFAVAAASLLVGSLTVASAGLYAASPFDGQYTGGSPSTGRLGCPATTATVSIVDGKIKGSYTSSSYTFPISGTVAPDGTVTGKWSVYPLTGKIIGSHFDGSVNSTECKTARPITLDKKG